MFSKLPHSAKDLPERSDLLNKWKIRDSDVNIGDDLVVSRIHAQYNFLRCLWGQNKFRTVTILHITPADGTVKHDSCCSR